MQENSPRKVKDEIIAGFGRRFKELFKGLTYEEIGQLLGVGQSAVANYVANRVPKIQIIFKILEVRPCSLHWLLTGEGPQQIGETLDIELSEEEQHVIAEIAASGGITFNEAVAHLVRESLAMKGVGEMPGMTPVPVYPTMDEVIFKRIEELPAQEQQDEMMRLIGKLMVKAAGRDEQLMKR